MKSSPAVGANHPMGLANLSNTCFLNASLQALSSVDAFLKFLRKDVIIDGEYCLLRLAQHYLMLLAAGSNTPSRSLNPLDLLLAFREKCRLSGSGGSFVAGTAAQQDAQEFTALLLEMIASEWEHARADVEKGLRSVIVARSPGCCSVLGTRWRPHPPPLACGASFPFSGRLVSKLRCARCLTPSPDRTSPFTVLSLAIPRPCVDAKPCGNGMLRIDDCLAHFIAEEQVADVECARCANRGLAHKQLLLARPPNALCIHIQRRCYNATNGVRLLG